MATNKHATIRYNALDKCFSNFGRKYFMEDLLEACNEAISEFTGSSEGVKRRQIYDDIRFMKSEQGYNAPIESYREGKKVYQRYADPDFSINKQEVSPREQQQLNRAIEILSRFEGLPDFEWVQELKVRLDDQVPGVKQNEPNTFISFQSNPYLKGMEFFTPLYNAIRHKRTVEIEYQSYKSDEPKVFQLSPYHLKQYNNRWFLFGQSVLYGGLTNIALDRIIALKEIDKPFISKAFDFQTYFEDVVGVTVPDNGIVERVLLRVNRSLYPYIASKPIHGSQKVIERTEDYVLLELEVMVNYELKSVLRSYGSNLSIFQPIYLKEEFQINAEEIKRK